MMKEIEIVVAENAEQAEQYKEQGYCPIECSFGEVSVVDELQMDHHGELSHLEPVCIRAFRFENFGKRSRDPRFVVAGGPDADALLAILALAAEIEDPNNPSPELCGWEYNPEDEPWKIGALHAWEKWSGAAFSLYKVAARRDRDPHVNLGKAEKNYISNVLLWFLQQRFRDWNEAVQGMERAIETWRKDNRAFAHCLEKEKERQQAAIKDMENGTVFPIYRTDMTVLFVEPDAGFGFDVWYSEHHFVVLRNKERGFITIGARDASTAKHVTYHKDRGLLDLFQELSKEQPGWGGSPTVGGSPRGQEMTTMDAIRAVTTLCCMVSNQRRAYTGFELNA